MFGINVDRDNNEEVSIVRSGEVKTFVLTIICTVELRLWVVPISLLVLMVAVGSVPATSLLFVAVGNNAPFWLGIVGEFCADGRVPRLDSTGMNEVILSIEPDGTFVFVSWKEGIEL
jgi:hypothetical protein